MIFLFIVLLFLHVSLTLVFQFTAWPEMLAYPYLLSKGFTLYGDVIHPYLPLLPQMLFTSFKLFGFSILVLRIITICFLLFSDYLIFLITKKLFSQKIALTSVFFFVLFSMIIEANGLWFDLVSVPLILLLVYLALTKKMTRFNAITTGIIIGIAILTKQTNAVFLIPFLFLNRKSIINLCLVLLFILIIFIPVFFYYFLNGQFEHFFYWSIIHPLFVHSRLPGFVLLPTQKQLLLFVFFFLPIFFILKRNLILGIFIVLSLLFAVPRFAYFHLVPSIALLTIGIGYLLEKNKLLFFVYSFSLFGVFILFMSKNSFKEVRFFESSVKSTRAKISSVLSDQPVYFFNVPAQYWVLGNLLPTKPWVDLFPWYLEVEGVQEKVIIGIAAVNYVIYKQPILPASFDLGAYHPEKIINYIDSNFEKSKEIEPGLFLLRRKQVH